MEHARTPIPIRPAPTAIDRGGPLVRALYTVWLAKAIREPGDDFAEDRLRGDPAALAIVQRATSVATTVAGNGAALVATNVGDFLRSLDPLSAASALIARGPVISLDGASPIYPPLAESDTPTAPWVAEGDPIAVSSMAFGSLTLAAKKASLIIIMSREIAKRAGAQAIFSQILRESAAKTLDLAYFGSQAGSDEACAGLLYDLQPLIPQPGSGVEAMRSDMAALAAAVSVNGSGQVIFVTSPDRAAKAQIVDPDSRAIILPSKAVPADRLICIDPVSVVHGFGGGIDILASNAATIHMNTEPAEIVSGTGPTTAAPIRSLFQTDSIGLRALVDIGFVKRRANAVAYVDGLNSW